MFIDMKRWAKTMKKKGTHTHSDQNKHTVYSISAMFSPNISKIKNLANPIRDLTRPHRKAHRERAGRQAPWNKN